jgi:hypothetical protein
MPPDQALEALELARALQSAVRALEPMQRRAVRLRFGLDSGHELSWAAVAKRMKLSRERARQLTAEALQRLRAARSEPFNHLHVAYGRRPWVLYRQEQLIAAAEAAREWKPGAGSVHAARALELAIRNTQPPLCPSCSSGQAVHYVGNSSWWRLYVYRCDACARAFEADRLFTRSVICKRK